MGSSIRFVLHNLPAILLGVAFVAAILSRRGPFPERLLGWILLLPIGLTGLWAGVFHIFFAKTAAAFIGWKTSPFQFEVGIADLAFGATACLAFWRSLEFKAAAVMVSSIALLGDAIGHIRQMLTAQNFAPGNAGIVFYMDIACPLLAILLLRIAQGGRRPWPWSR
ncbi:MAG: DUF6790 family protein [Methylovirgula sp.]|uniref:DUF6790 family protein n=1 Tax=Methylovirgula sp. TaxID=1978224 RepID=UPI0030760CB5